MISNASLLSFLTISCDNAEQVVFLHLKEVHDVAPSSLYWYKNKGQNGNAIWLWPEKKLRQWLLIGEDREVRQIFDRLLGQQVYDFTFKQFTIKFTIPETVAEVNDTSIYTIDHIDPIGRNELPLTFKAVEPVVDIDFLINEATNCKYIEGYLQHPVVKPLYPTGLVPENTLLKCVNGQVCAQLESRGLYLDFRGSGKDEQTGDSTMLSGFIQAPVAQRTNMGIVIRDLDGGREIGSATIDDQTGRWQASLNEPAGRGQILIKGKLSDKILFGEKFYLLKDIQINTQAVSTVIRDLFGRNINVSGKEKVTIPEEMVVWDFNAAPDERQGKIELSDKLKNIMLSLGKSITFVDPYFFGDIKHNNKTLLLGPGQEVFLNALITALVCGEIEHINIVGYWQRAKSQSAVSQTDYIANYRVLYQVIYRMLGKRQVAKLKTFQLINSRESFHDRYWQGEQEVYYLSNSINGAYESRELTIRREDKLNKLKLVPKFNRRASGDVFDLKSSDVL